MAINWFPGHMHKARKDIKKVMPQMDLIIEVLDARIPFSSENPLVPALRQDKPVIKILNKADLADSQVTRQWQEWLEREDGVRTLALQHKQRKEALSILQLARDMTPSKEQERRAIRVMILGIPNVGKSTLINTLAGRTIAKTGNEPAVTKSQQVIKLPDNILLYDTPGFLWPKLSPPACGYRLAVTGAIRSAVLEFDEVALFAVEYLRDHHPEVLRERYRLDSLPEDGVALMDAIARQRGFMARGGIPDLHKVSEVILTEYRAGTLGRISLETPALIEQEQAELAAAEAAKAAQDQSGPADD